MLTLMNISKTELNLHFVSPQQMSSYPYTINFPSESRVDGEFIEAK